MKFKRGSSVRELILFETRLLHEIKITFYYRFKLETI